MRILQLCNKPPFPTVDGGTIAMHALTQGLIDAGHTVKVIAIETDKHPFKRSLAIDDYIKQTAIETVHIDTNIKPMEALKAVLTGKLYILERFISKQVETLLEKTLRQHDYDCVLLEGLYVAPYIETIRRASKAKIILRAHNIEYLIWQRVLFNSRHPLRYIYLQLMVAQLKRYEVAAFTKVDGIAAISAVDEKYIKQLAPAAKVTEIPLSTTYKPIEGVVPEPNSVFHLGSMDWQPNLEGITWFLNDVWPLVIEQNTNAKLYLAGRNMPKHLFSYANKNISIEGAIDSPEAFMTSKQIMVVPLFSGSGVRVKIIEGMALGKAIVATPMAVEGLTVSHKKNSYIAGNGEQFVDAILDLLYNPNLTEQLGKNAAAYVDAHHCPGVVIEKLVGFIEKI